MANEQKESTLVRITPPNQSENDKLTFYVKVEYNKDGSLTEQSENFVNTLQTKI